MPCSSVRAALLARRHGHAVQFTCWPVGRSQKKRLFFSSHGWDGKQFVSRPFVVAQTDMPIVLLPKRLHPPAPTWLDDGNRRRRLRNADLRIGPPLLSSRLHLGRPRFGRASHTATSTHETGLAPVIIRPPDGPEADESRENRKEASSWIEASFQLAAEGASTSGSKNRNLWAALRALLSTSTPQGSTGHVRPKQQQTRFRPSP